MNATQPTTDRPDAVTARFEALSALTDSCADELELEQLLSEMDADTSETLQRYQLIGDALRGTLPANRVGSDPMHLLSRVRAGLADEHLRPQTQGLTRPAVAAVQVPVAAANDSVFRWKLAAGFASVAAVMAVSWSLMGVGVPGAGPAASSPVLVQAPAGGEVDTDPPEAVLVMTPQGAVVRDPQLEQLLNEHRQFGGMTALQAPTGFLRNATYDNEGR
ncbi:sigma-E factor negative regulatory protein [uncultured Hydrogenophaga sp.]|uniref:sigma-E factor negative regulatory protein n=1 Tax=uncultured Hydrogenophaga sp. TaxID=199683 RepID=UPI002660184E|nr:RseA family anti-sigma factor [uncultured Hydrogenophaga sp.]